MRLRRKKRCKHVHWHEEVGPGVVVTRQKYENTPDINLALLDVWAICDDCGHREERTKRVGESTKPPGRYIAS